MADDLQHGVTAQDAGTAGAAIAAGANLKPGATGQLKVNVLAGDYLLNCNIRGHYETGMVAPLTVVD